MKKQTYVIILVILIVLLFSYIYYLQYYSNHIEGLTGILKQQTTNNNPTNGIDGLIMPFLLYLNNITSLTFVNDTANISDNLSRITINNIRFTLNGQPFDFNRFINYYLKNTNKVDIGINPTLNKDIKQLTSFPGKIITKVSDNTQYKGLDFNSIINSSYRFINNNITSINVTRNPKENINLNGPILNKITINNNFMITINGKEFKIDEKIIPLDIMLNLALVDVESVDVTVKNPGILYNYLDKKTNIPLASEISLKSK
jgi:hypothetical protein